MSETGAFDVVIIGAGVVGCSIALSLSREGLRTVNVDMLPAAGYGSTSHSSAIVRSFYSHVTSCAVAQESRFRWLEWPEFLGRDDDSGCASYTECGGLVLMLEGREEDYAVNLKVLDEVGVPYELLGAARVEKLYPGICLDAFGPPRPMAHAGFGTPVSGRVSSGIYMPQAGYVSDPQLATRNLQQAAAGLGGQFRFGVRVSTVLQDDKGVLGVMLEDSAQISAPVVVNAAGPHSAKINSLAGVADTLNISTRAERHEVSYLRAPPGYVEHGNGFLVDVDSGTYQRPDGVDLLIGSTDPACDPPIVVDPDDYSTGLTEQWTQQVHRAAQRFPGLGIENTARGTVGLYDVSDDWIPMYDKTDLEGFYLAIGTSGNQFKNAPVVGDLMAQVIMAAAQDRDHDHTPARLVLPHVDRTVGLDFYSRRRKPQATRSVMA